MSGVREVVPADPLICLVRSFPLKFFSLASPRTLIVSPIGLSVLGMPRGFNHFFPLFFQWFALNAVRRKTISQIFPPFLPLDALVLCFFGPFCHQPVHFFLHSGRFPFFPNSLKLYSPSSSPPARLTDTYGAAIALTASLSFSFRCPLLFAGKSVLTPRPFPPRSFRRNLRPPRSPL